jgi:hypothetical protein
MIDKHPALIARCADVADVIQSVNFARDNNLLLAVRGGGHNGAGLGSCNGGLVIDLGRMKGISINPTARTARVDGGCVWGDVDHATHAFGLATPSGIISTTGVGGLTLGGGHGYLTRKYGLTIDNLLAVDIVLEDGSLVTASADENADLFWAVRGGGGNFGVVTSFLFKLHPVSTVIGGPMFWDLKRSKEILAFWREFMPKAPEELSGFFALLQCPRSRLSQRNCILKEYVPSSGVIPGNPIKPKWFSNPSASLPLCWTRLGCCLTRLCRACSMLSTHQDCNGSGVRTSSRRSTMQRSTYMSSVHKKCLKCIPPCTFIRSMGRLKGLVRTTLLLATAMPAIPR